MCNAAAPSRLLIRPARAAATRPARGNSFRLIVKVSMGGRQFHGAVTPRHFHVAVAVGGQPLDTDALSADPRAHRATRVASHVRTVHRAEPGVGSSGASVSPTRAVTSGTPSDNAG